MEKLEHPLWIVQAANALFGPLVRALLAAIGRPAPPGGDVIPNYLVMGALIVLIWTILALILRRNIAIRSKPWKSGSPRKSS